MLDVFLLGFILYGTLCTSWIWLTISFSMLGKFSTIISSNLFSYSFFFSSFSGTSIIQMLVNLISSQGSLRLSSVLFILFTLFCSSEVISNILSYSSLIYSSALDILLLIPSRLFLIYENLKWQPTPVLLPGESHGGSSLVGYSPWGRKESDMTAQNLCLS